MSTQPLKLAVASKDGIAINLHFGHAREFGVFAVTASDCSLLKRRSVDHYCHGQTGDESAMQEILATVNDYSAVMVAKVGDGPVAKLAAIGVAAIDDNAYLGIRDSLPDYARRHAAAETEGVSPRRRVRGRQPQSRNSAGEPRSDIYCAPCRATSCLWRETFPNPHGERRYTPKPRRNRNSSPIYQSTTVIRPLNTTKD